MDLTESIAPRSDQVNADDLVGGPITYTIREVKAGAAEQPFDFMLVETDRAYRPSKTMRRLIVAAWGPDADQYAGRRLTLYREPTIKFGGATVGGIRISHMSHITKRIDEKFQTTRGKRETFTVNPLPDPTPADLLASLRAEWHHAEPARRKEIEAEVAALTGPSTEPEPIDVSDMTAVELITPQQLKRLHTLCSVKGFVDRDDTLDYIRNVVQLDITSTKDLTREDASKVIDALAGLADPA